MYISKFKYILDYGILSKMQFFIQNATLYSLI